MIASLAHILNCMSSGVAHRETGVSSKASHSVVVILRDITVIRSWVYLFIVDNFWVSCTASS